MDRIDTDRVELRLDYLSSPCDIDLDALEGKKNRLILTLRDVSEGGAQQLDHGRKKAFLDEAVRRGFLVDVEATFAEEHDFNCRGQIVSRHYLDTDPDYSVLVEFAEKYRDVSYITKVALRSSESSRNLIARLLSEYENLAVMEVDGEESSRLLFSVLGSRLLYCHVGNKTSPGQMNCREAGEFFRIISGTEKRTL